MVLGGSTLLVSHYCECVHSILHDITDIMLLLYSCSNNIYSSCEYLLS